MRTAPHHEHDEDEDDIWFGVLEDHNMSPTTLSTTSNSSSPSQSNNNNNNNGSPVTGSNRSSHRGSASPLEKFRNEEEDAALQQRPSESFTMATTTTKTIKTIPASLSSSSSSNKSLSAMTHLASVTDNMNLVYSTTKGSGVQSCWSSNDSRNGTITPSPTLTMMDDGDDPTVHHPKQDLERLVWLWVTRWVVILIMMVQLGLILGIGYRHGLWSARVCTFCTVMIHALLLTTDANQLGHSKKMTKEAMDDDEGKTTKTTTTATTEKKNSIMTTNDEHHGQTTPLSFSPVNRGPTVKHHRALQEQRARTTNNNNTSPESMSNSSNGNKNKLKTRKLTLFSRSPNHSKTKQHHDGNGHEANTPSRSTFQRPTPSQYHYHTPPRRQRESSINVHGATPITDNRVAHPKRERSQDEFMFRPATAAEI